MYEFTYLVWALIFLPLWIAIFFARKNLRKPMVLLGVIFGAMAPTSDFLWFLKDYWHPLTTVAIPTFILEDFFYVFILTGVMLFSYPAIFKKNVDKIDWRRLAAILVLAMIPFLILSGVFGIGSIWSLFISQSVIAIYMWIKNKKAVVVSIFNFIYGIIIGTLAFLILLHFYPSIASAWWLPTDTPFVAGIPLGEILWLGFVGAGFGILPEFINRSISHIDTKNSRTE